MRAGCGAGDSTVSALPSITAGLVSVLLDCCPALTRLDNLLGWDLASLDLAALQQRYGVRQNTLTSADRRGEVLSHGLVESQFLNAEICPAGDVGDWPSGRFTR